MAIETIQCIRIEVFRGPLFVGTGLMYHNGYDMLKPDIVSITGEVLPSGDYTLVYVGTPWLAVMPKNVQ